MADRLIGAVPPLRQLVYEKIRDLIIEGVYRPGEHLIETELAADFGVSRGPVREALYMLAQERWVDLRPRQGAFVHVADLAEVEELFAARRAMEGETASLAAQRSQHYQRDELERLHRLLDGSKRQIEGDAQVDAQVVSTVNFDFHHEIALLAGNRVFLELLPQLARQSQWYYSALVPVRAEKAYHEHTDIADAIINGDADRARELMHAHIDITINKYREMVHRIQSGTHHDADGEFREKVAATRTAPDAPGSTR